MTEKLKQFLAEKQETQQIKSGRKETASTTATEQLKQTLLEKSQALEEYQPSPNGFLSLKEVQLLTGGKSRSTIYRWSRDGILPKPRKIGPNSIAWLRSEIDAWVGRFQGDA